MNINKYIINSLSELEIPISFREYIGNEKTFITKTYIKDDIVNVFLKKFAKECLNIPTYMITAI